jgi:protein-S-isoprenylcysteine O-methyltransferase Ste14
MEAPGPVGAVADGGGRPTTRPRSATGIGTGLAGVAALLAATLGLRDWAQPAYLKALVVLAIAALAMLLVDLVVYRVDRNASTGLGAAPLRRLDLRRVMRKLVGFWGTIGTLAALYLLLPEYEKPFYQPFRDAALIVLSPLAVASSFYIAYVDRRQHEPEDAYALLGALLLTGRRPADLAPLYLHARGWLVKGFFLPLMFVYATDNLTTMWAAPLLPAPDFQHVFSRLIDLFYFIDVAVAAIAYALTLRLIDTQMRSVEPSVGGWVVCLICYPPIVDVQAPYIQYELDKVYWGAVFAPWPWLYALWGSVILALVFVYAWSTVAFGLRFSNLTHRGIITGGPYRWARHPAYLSKNLSWWLISVPFVATAGWGTAVLSCAMLGAVNLIYYMRARTEERHLRADPVYRQYCAFIAAHGVGAQAARLLRRLRPAA